MTNVVRREELRVKSELSGANSTLRNLRDELRRLDAQSQQQQEDLYTAEFKVQQMERKVKRTLGVRYVVMNCVGCCGCFRHAQVCD